MFEYRVTLAQARRELHQKKDVSSAWIFHEYNYLSLSVYVIDFSFRIISVHFQNYRRNNFYIYFVI